MKILLTTESVSREQGGVATCVVHLASSLADLGVDVSVWAADGSSIARQQGKSISNIKGAINSVHDHVAQGIDLVHDHGIWLPYHNDILNICQKFNVPRVVSPHGMLEPWALRYKPLKKKIAWHLFQKSALQAAAVIHATADSEASQLDSLGVRPLIKTVPNGVELPALPKTNNIGGKRGGTNRKKRALFLSRIHPKKGLSMLLDAWSTSPTLDWELLIVGPAEEGHDVELQKKISELKLDEQVKLSGPVFGREKSRLFYESDLFILPTFSENFGLVIAEALVHGLPVLTTTATPWRKIQDANLGWWVQPNLNSLTIALGEALKTSSESRYQMGRRGERFVRENYAWPNVARKMIAEVYFSAGNKIGQKYNL